MVFQLPSTIYDLWVAGITLSCLVKHFCLHVLIELGPWFSIAYFSIYIKFFHYFCPQFQNSSQNNCSNSLCNSVINRSVLSFWRHLFSNVCLFAYLFILRERGRERRGEAKREGDSPKQALCCHRRAQRGAQTHQPWDHDLSQKSGVRCLTNWATQVALSPIVLKLYFMFPIF